MCESVCILCMAVCVGGLGCAGMSLSVGVSVGGCRCQCVWVCVCVSVRVCVSVWCVYGLSVDMM